MIDSRRAFLIDRLEDSASIDAIDAIDCLSLETILS